MNRIGQFESLLTKAIDTVGLEIPPCTIPLLTEHNNLLRKWNSTFNLTSLEKTEDIIDRLYIDSLLFLKDLPDHLSLLLDVGSGPGFPGIPILTAKPQVKLVILEPKGKICAFLSEVQYAFKSKLEYKIVNSRCDSREFIDTNQHRFPVIISKAFKPTRDALELMAPILKPGGFYSTCINPETPFDTGLRSEFTLQSDMTYILPLTGKPSRHLIFRHKITG